MISRKPKKKSSNLHYRSARAIPPLNSQGRNKLLSQRCKWILLKGLILVSGLCLFLGSLFLPFIANVTTEKRGMEHSPIKAITGQLEEIKMAVESMEDKIEKAVSGTKEQANLAVESMEDKIEKAVSGTKEQANLARGLSGLPMSETPALVGGERGHIECDTDVDRLAYWNDPQGQRDVDFKSPFIGNSGVSYVNILTKKYVQIFLFLLGIKFYVARSLHHFCSCKSFRANQSI